MANISNVLQSNLIIRLSLKSRHMALPYMILKATLNNKKYEDRYLYQCSGPDITGYCRFAHPPEGNNSNCSYMRSDIQYQLCFQFRFSSGFPVILLCGLVIFFFTMSRIFSLVSHCIDFLKSELILSQNNIIYLVLYAVVEEVFRSFTSLKMVIPHCKNTPILSCSWGHHSESSEQI